MRKIAFTTPAVFGAAMAAIALPTAAQAQTDEPTTEVTIGASVGLHDLGADSNDPAFAGIDIDDSGEIFGGFIAVDVPIGGNLFGGVEGNAHFGSGAIDSDYGLSARFGFRTEGDAKVYVRGGYQWVDVDVSNLIGFEVDEAALGIDTTIGDYLVGVGTEVPVGGVVLRANVDTIAFDSLRGTIGVGFKF
jgi:opacity protein-like surface antigen